MSHYDLLASRASFKRNAEEVERKMLERIQGMGLVALPPPAKADLGRFSEDLDAMVEQFRGEGRRKMQRSSSTPFQIQQQQKKRQPQRQKQAPLPPPPAPRSASRTKTRGRTQSHPTPSQQQQPSRSRRTHRTSPDELRSVIRSVQKQRTKAGMRRAVSADGLREDTASLCCSQSSASGTPGRRQQPARHSLVRSSSAQQVHRPVSWERSLRSAAAPTKPQPQRRRRREACRLSPPPSSERCSVRREAVPHTFHVFSDAPPNDHHANPTLRDAGLADPISPQRCDEPEAIPFTGDTYPAVPWPYPSPAKGCVCGAGRQQQKQQERQQVHSHSLSPPSPQQQGSVPWSPYRYPPSLPSTVMGTQSLSSPLLSASYTQAAKVFPHLYQGTGDVCPGEKQLQAVPTTYRSALVSLQPSALPSAAPKKMQQQQQHQQQPPRARDVSPIYPPAMAESISPPQFRNSNPLARSPPQIAEQRQQQFLLYQQQQKQLERQRQQEEEKQQQDDTDSDHDEKVARMMERIMVLQSYLPKHHQPQPRSTSPFYHDFR